VVRGCFCPRRGCLAWTFGGVRLVLSTQGVPGVDVWWPQVGFVHAGVPGVDVWWCEVGFVNAGMHFCGCFESGGIFANFAAYLAFYVRVY